jgi:hypothetical protein
MIGAPIHRLSCARADPQRGPGVGLARRREVGEGDGARDQRVTTPWRVTSDGAPRAVPTPQLELLLFTHNILAATLSGGPLGLKLELLASAKLRN